MQLTPSSLPQKVEPKIGMGVTQVMWSDRHPYTIIEISGSGRRMVIQADTAIVVSGNRADGSAEYEYERNPTGEKLVISRRKDGVWRQSGSGRGSSHFAIGIRREYYDPSF